jgi:hypothetical protein
VRVSGEKKIIIIIVHIIFTIILLYLTRSVRVSGERAAHQDSEFDGKQDPGAHRRNV